MKAENLESLVLDRALGELRPEVADLLDDYLTEHPAAAAQAAALAATVQTARRAAGPHAAATLPPLAVTRLQREARILQWRTRTAEFARLAACLVLGVAAGWLVRPESPGGAAAGRPAVHVLAVAETPAAGDAGLWSVSHLMAGQRARNAAGRRAADYGVRWGQPSNAREIR